MKKENQRVIITKQMLRNALLRLLENKHIDKVSVKELCEEAGVNRSTFYRYYTLPKDLLVETMLETFQVLEIKKPFQGQEDVRAYLERSIQFLYENADLTRILVRNTTPDDYSHVMTAFAGRLLEVNGIQNLSPQKIDLLLAYIGAGSVNTIRQWLSAEDPLRPEELVDFTMSMALQSMNTVFRSE